MPIDKKDIPVTDRAVTMEKIIALCKNRGYIFPGSEIYGGLSALWAWSSRTTSRTHGDRSSSESQASTSDSMRQF